MEKSLLSPYLNTIQNIDCIEGLKRLPDRCIDLIIADPPYFKTIGEKWDFKWRIEEDYLTWCESWIKELSRVAKFTASFYIFGYFRTLCLMVPLIEKHHFELRQQIIINKGIQSVSGRKTSTYKMFPTTTESILFFVYNCKPEIQKFLLEQQEKSGLKAKEINEKLGVKTNGGGMWSLYSGDNILAQIPTKEMWDKLKSIFGFNKEYNEIAFTFHPIMGLTDVWDDIDFYKEERVHPTQKPLKLIRRLILASSDENMVVLDPFMGSGTTALACKQLNRNFIGFELENKYVKLASERIKQPTLLDYFKEEENKISSNNIKNKKLKERKAKK